MTLVAEGMHLISGDEVLLITGPGEVTVDHQPGCPALHASKWRVSASVGEGNGEAAGFRVGLGE